MADQAQAAPSANPTFDPMFQLNITLQQLLQLKDKYIVTLENENQLLKEKCAAFQAMHENAQNDIGKLKEINKMAIDADQGKQVDPSKIRI